MQSPAHNHRFTGIRKLPQAVTWGFFKELGIVMLAYIFYFFVRGLVAGRAGDAMIRSARVLNFEDRVGLFWELDMQAWALSHEALTQFFNQIYIWGNFPFIGAVAIWFYFCYRPRYVLYRNAFLLSGAIALIIFVTLPTAPPRFLWWAGFQDTVLRLSESYYTVQPEGYVNRYAAIPSMHFGWVLLLGIAIVSTTRFRPMQVVGVVMPVLMFLSVVVTGNHFIIDTIVGGAVSLTGLLLALTLDRHGDRIKRVLLPTRSNRSAGMAS